MKSGGSKKISQQFFLGKFRGWEGRKKKSNCANDLGPSCLAQGQERTENEQASTGLSIQMVRSWVLIHFALVNHPLQAYYNLVVDETQLPNCKLLLRFTWATFTVEKKVMYVVR